MAKGRKTGGRQKGTPNKITGKTREMVAKLVDENLPLASAWLKDAWATKPDIAARLFGQMLEYASPKYSRLDPLAEKAAQADAAKAGTKPADEMSDAELEALVRSSPEFQHAALTGPTSAAEAGLLYDTLRAAIPGSLQERVAGKALELTAGVVAAPAHAALQRRQGGDAGAASPSPRTPPAQAPVLEEPAPIALGGATLMPREPTAEHPAPRRERKPEGPRCSAIWLTPGEHRVVHPDRTVEIVTIPGGDAKWWQPPVEGAYVVDNTLQRSMRIGGGVTILAPAALAAPSDAHGPAFD